MSLSGVTRGIKAVILGASPGTALFALANHCNKLTLPIANTPMLDHTLAWLERNGITEVAVILPEAEEESQAFRWRRRAKGLVQRTPIFIREPNPLGTAGALLQVREFVCDADFLVVNGNVYVDDLDLQPAVRHHRESKASITVLTQDAPPGRLPGLERVVVDSNGQVREIVRPYEPRDAAEPQRPAGAYIFSPSVFEHLGGGQYFDIKEQLIPALHAEGKRVAAYRVEGVQQIDSVADYLHVNRQVLFRRGNSRTQKGTSSGGGSYGVFIGEGARISPDAQFFGPVLVGSDCTIEPHARIVGPAVIGDDSHIRRGATVRESVLCAGTSIGENSCVEYSVSGFGATIPDGSNITGSAVVASEGGTKTWNVSVTSSQFDLPVLAADRATPGAMLAQAFREQAYAASKRAMDIAAAMFGLVVFSPLILFITALVKLSSEGPAFFVQERRGKGGRKFRMLKFRTMVVNSEALRQGLTSRNAVDGPVFKIHDDPRITPLGKLLRRTSLDELPQLVNVLRGEMSLVGPRPLVIEEMQFCPGWRDLRLSVKPGITGLWQVSGRGNAAFHTWIQNDIRYVRGRSFWLDLKILLMTLAIVLKRTGAI